MSNDDSVPAIDPVRPPAEVDASAVWSAVLAHFDERDVVDDLALVVSELVTNVVRHTSCDEAAVALFRSRDTLRVEVSDGDTTPPHLTTGPVTEHGSGLGLRIVDSLSSRWGVRAATDGKTVWAEFDRER